MQRAVEWRGIVGCPDGEELPIEGCRTVVGQGAALSMLGAGEVVITLALRILTPEVIGSADRLEVRDVGTIRRIARRDGRILTWIREITAEDLRSKR